MSQYDQRGPTSPDRLESLSGTSPAGEKHGRENQSAPAPDSPSGARPRAGGREAAAASESQGRGRLKPAKVAPPSLGNDPAAREQLLFEARSILARESSWKASEASSEALGRVDAFLEASGLSISPGAAGATFPQFAACTIVSKNYLSLARVWNQSFRKHHPGARTFVLIVDRIEGAFDPAAEDFEVIEVEQLEIPRFEDLAFKYNILELNTTVKPFLLEYLLSEKNLERVVYLDPDILFFAPLTRVGHALVDENIVLVPHILSPMLSDGKLPNETDFLISGTYNLGFIGVRRSDDSLAFLNWWKQHLLDHGFSAPERGLFTDQKWIDLVPSIFPRVAVVKDRGYNAAYWNVPERLDLEVVDGTYRFADTPLTFFHFSGIEFDRPERVSKYQNRFRLYQLNPAYRALFSEYVSRVRDSGFEQTRSWRYAFAYFDDGTAISSYVRRLYHALGERRDRWQDPFRTLGPGTFKEWLLESAGFGFRIPRFLADLFRARSDLQAAFPDGEVSNARGLLHWALHNVPQEYGLDGFFLDELRRRIADIDASSVSAFETPPVPEPTGIATPNDSAPAPAVEEPDQPEEGHPRKQGKRLIERLLGAARYRSGRRIVCEIRRRQREQEPRVAAAQPWRGRGGSFLEALLGEPLCRKALALVWVFRDVLSEPGGPLEEGPARTPFKRLVEGLLGRRFYRMFRRLLWKLREWSRTSTAASMTAPDRIVPLTVVPEPAGGYPFGVNLFGYFDTESGIGEIARSMAGTLRAGQIPHVLVNVEQPWLRRKDFTLREFASANPYAVNLFVVNADMVPTVLPSFGRAALDRPRNVGYWFWELSRFPDRFQGSFRFFSEVWVASSFCLESISSSSPIPVVKIPPGFDFHIPGRRTRASFGIEPDDLVFLYIFDGASSFNRKNPGGIVSAFRRAFPQPGREKLILKTVNAPASKVEALMRLARGSRVGIVADYMNREDLLDLLAAADCYVSLHRSEGFGLTILESMAMGKPVIATDYSGNEDFLHRGNGFPVGYRLVPIRRSLGPYTKGNVWAEPDLDQAAAFLKRIAEQPDEVRRVGRTAQAEIRERWSVGAAGCQLRHRLEILCRLVGLEWPSAKVV